MSASHYYGYNWGHGAPSYSTPSVPQMSTNSMLVNPYSQNWNPAGPWQHYQQQHYQQQHYQQLVTRIQSLERMVQAQAQELEISKRLDQNRRRETIASTLALFTPPENPESASSAPSSSDHSSQLVLPSLYSFLESLNTKWYTRKPFLDAVKARPTARYPVSLSAYLEDKNGQPIAPHIKSEVFSTAHAVWHEFLQQNSAPKNFSKASSYQANYFRFVLCNKFPFLLYAESYWKVDRIWSTQYSAWYNRHVKLSTQPSSGESNSDSKDIDDDDDNNNDNSDDNNNGDDSDDDSDSSSLFSILSAASESTLKRLPESDIETANSKKRKIAAAAPPETLKENYPETASVQSMAAHAQVTPFESPKIPADLPTEPSVTEQMAKPQTVTETSAGINPWEPPKADKPRNRCAREWKKSHPNGEKSEFDAYYAALSENDKQAYRKYKLTRKD